MKMMRQVATSSVNAATTQMPAMAAVLSVSGGGAGEVTGGVGVAVHSSGDVPLTAEEEQKMW